MMRIGFAGSATNPSHLGHEWVLRKILSSGLFDLVIWYPSGFSTFKPTLLDGIHRQQLAHLAFPQSWIYAPDPGWASLLLDLSATMQEDIPTALRFQMLEKQYPGSEITFITGSDAVTPNDGVFPILGWYHQEILCRKKVMIIPRAGFAIPGEVELLPFTQWFCDDIAPDYRSGIIRAMILSGDPTWETHVNKKVRKYIKLHKLYQKGYAS